MAKSISFRITQICCRQRESLPLLEAIGYRNPFLTYIRQRRIKCSLAQVGLEGLFDQAGVVFYHVRQLLEIVRPVMDGPGSMRREPGLKPLIGLNTISRVTYWPQTHEAHLVDVRERALFV